jgi:hypothetical protein
MYLARDGHWGIREMGMESLGDTGSYPDWCCWGAVWRGGKVGGGTAHACAHPA